MVVNWEGPGVGGDHSKPGARAGLLPLPSTPLFPCTARVFAEDAAISSSSGARATAGHSPPIQRELPHTDQPRMRGINRGEESIPLPRAHHSGDPTLDGLPGIFTAVLGIHPGQVPGSGEQIRLGAVGSVVGCRERAVMLRGAVGSQQGRLTSPSPTHPSDGFPPAAS